VNGRYRNLNDEEMGVELELNQLSLGVAIGVRSMVIDQLELTAQVKQIMLDEISNTGFKAGINYYFTPALAIGATYEDRDKFSFTGAHVRYAY